MYRLIQNHYSCWWVAGLNENKANLRQSPENVSIFLPTKLPISILIKIQFKGPPCDGRKPFFPPNLRSSIFLIGNL